MAAIAIATGFKEAVWTILDANITTFITAIILFNYGTGPIKGFAVTLSVGIVTSVFAALVITRALFALLAGWARDDYGSDDASKVARATEFVARCESG